MCIVLWSNNSTNTTTIDILAFWAVIPIASCILTLPIPSYMLHWNFVPHACCWNVCVDRRESGKKHFNIIFSILYWWLCHKQQWTNELLFMKTVTKLYCVDEYSKCVFPRNGHFYGAHELYCPLDLPIRMGPLAWNVLMVLQLCCHVVWEKEMTFWWINMWQDYNFE